jgi:hypothetical protein
VSHGEVKADETSKTFNEYSPPINPNHPVIASQRKTKVFQSIAARRFLVQGEFRRRSGSEATRDEPKRSHELKIPPRRSLQRNNPNPSINRPAQEKTKVFQSVPARGFLV